MKYPCGHSSNEIIMNETSLGLSAYFTWKEDFADKMCFDCYLKKYHKVLRV